MYVICWKAVTGKTGKGTRLFNDKNEAERIVESMKMVDDQIGMIHWIEKIDE